MVIHVLQQQRKLSIGCASQARCIHFVCVCKCAQWGREWRFLACNLIRIRIEVHGSNSSSRAQIGACVRPIFFRISRSRAPILLCPLHCQRCSVVENFSGRAAAPSVAKCRSQSTKASAAQSVSNECVWGSHKEGQ